MPLADTRPRSRGESATELFADDAVEVDKAHAEWSRSSEVSQITDVGELAMLARTDVCAAVRLAATERLSDPVMLATIARSDVDELVRIAAIKRITDEALLAEIGASDRVLRVREVAACHLANVRMLVGVATCKYADPRIRVAAASRIAALASCESGAAPA